ncbi:MAG: GGDEF domain-containing protein [Spirochaetaceae bacterium]
MKDVADLKKRIQLLTEQIENLTLRNSELSEELNQMRVIYVSSMDYGSTLENELDQQIKILSKENSVEPKSSMDHDRDLRLRLTLEISKNEHLELINKSLMEQVEQLRVLYVNVSSHSTALENDLDEKYEEVKRLSITDPLTGIYNRSGFYKSAEAIIDNMKRKNMPLSIIMMDIDNFKICNDTHGHDVGDEVLISITKTCLKSIRKSDILARWGGEEFIFIVPELNMNKTIELAERIRENIESEIYNICEKITCSFGVSTFNNEPIEHCIKRSDLALYEAKNRGKNRVEGYKDG